MGILDEDVARVREATDFVQLATEHIALKQQGSRWVGLCPFHAEKTGSFTINPELKLFYCFGCQAKGDVITFMREVEHLDFVEAVERLAGRAGIELRYDDAATSRDRHRRQRLFDAVEQAVEWYHQRLLSAADAGPARQYLRSRGYDGDTVRRFRLGWAPDDWDALCRHLALPEDVIKEAGLGFVNRVGRQQDVFRGRVMFPIFDPSGKAVAFGGRILSGAGQAGPGGHEQGPKYKNSPENAIYSKRKVLYGLNWAKADVVDSGEVLVCEGYTDVIGFFAAGLPRAVATCGTALAEDHFRLLKNFGRRVVLAYDADAAGQAAAERVYEWEQRYDVDVAVAGLPRGSDPADVARDDPDGLHRAVKEARPFLRFRVDRVLAVADTRTLEGKARAAERALDVIAEHPNEIVRQEYAGEVAVRLDIPAEQLLRSLRGAGSRATVRPVQLRRPAAEGPEVEALRLAVHRPAEIGEWLHECLFTDDLHVAAYRALAGAGTLPEAIESADPAASALLQRVAVDEAEGDVLDVVSRLLEEAARRALHRLQAEVAESDDKFLELSSLTGWLKLAVEELRDPAQRADAATRLLPWLVSRAEEDA